MMNMLKILFIFIFACTLITAQDDSEWLLLSDFEKEMNGWDNIAAEATATVDVIQGEDPSGDSGYSLEIQIDASVGGNAGFRNNNQQVIYDEDIASGIAIYVFVDGDFLAAASGVQIFTKDRIAWGWQSDWYDLGDLEEESWTRLYFDIDARLESVEGYDELIEDGVEAGVEFVFSREPAYSGSVYADNIYLVGIPADAVGIEIDPALQPATFDLEQNYPNPFNPVTSIAYTLTKRDMVTITIHEITGRLVTTLIDHEIQPAGRIVIPFNAENLSSGTYFYKVQTSNAVQVKKMVLIR
jgi:hypothetical protein